ncbi:hypothetical protein EDE08_101653 [Bradyrhizobium sp. R2.2-H]|jgi:hypothetical protein|uniref:hypothetical protein n=1 Tax=unclassified Bradyrhizobium TaxID=2631580 RepID=UPI001049E8E5|nr:MULTISPECIES: hypothetical protein [unclassified Bradyrhizobium]TCU78871.1 hypothetical protein EDE10_101654 [Bradyrhizobium sp. Y-H1]TCU80954.1 hypothetical protein EDE08_101653 [Bradyrhizobium sp. R2.2-H]
MATPTPYKDPEAASKGLTESFAPTTDAQKTAIANAAALVPGAAPASPAPSPIKVKRTVDTGADAAESYLSTFTAPKTADQIAEEMRRGSQGAIDAINKTYDDQVAAKGVIGQERLAQDNAISVLSGLTGSTEAGRTRGATIDKNDKEVQAVNNQRLLDLQSLYSQISKDARDEALKQREDATANANDIVARRTAAQGKAVENIKLMAQGGLVDFDSFKNSAANSEVYNHALEAVGGSEEALKGLFAVNRPKDQLVGSPVRVGDHFIQAYQNPLTGKIAYDTVQVPGGLPTEYKNFQKIGDNIVAIPDGWDGDMSKLKTIYAGSSIATTQAASQAAQQKNEALELAKELRSDTAVGKGSAVGASAAKLVPFGQALGWQGDRTAFEAKVASLKSNLTLDNLKLLKGAMSDKDLMFLNSIGSSLDTSMSEKAFNSELDRVIQKLESTGASASGGGNVVTAPDGQEVEIID